MFKRILTVLLATVMVVSVTACGTDKNSSTGEKSSDKELSSTVSGDDSGTDENGVTPRGTYPIVNEKITISGLISQPAHISDLPTNNYTVWLEEATNIHIDMIVTPDQGYADKMNLLLSTDDYPEMIMSGAADNAKVVKYGIEEKIYIPLNPYIEKYSENLVARWDEMPEIKEGMIAPDGNIYALPTFEGYTGHGAVGYKNWINTVWLDKLGLEKPTTTDEYIKVLTAFKNDDPNGNGIADEVPLSGATKTWAADPYLFLLNAFDYYDESLIKLKDGVYSTVADTDGFREGLRFINKLYKDGLLDPASLTQDEKQLNQLGNNEAGILGSFSAGHVGMGVDIANKDLFNQFDYLLPLKGPTGYQGTPTSEKQAVNGGPFAITDKCKNPAAAFRMADMWYGDFDSYAYQNYFKGKTWEEPTPGAKGITGLDAKYKYLQKVASSNDPEKDFWSQVSADGMIKDRKLYIEFTGNIRDVDNYEGYLIRATEEYKKFKAPYEQIMPAWLEAETSTNLANTITPIMDYVKASIVDFTTGKMNIETDWQKYLDGLDKLGYKKYVEDFGTARTE